MRALVKAKRELVFYTLKKCPIKVLLYFVFIVFDEYLRGSRSQGQITYCIKKITRFML